MFSLAENINIPIFTGGLFLTVWKIAMTSEAGRAAGQFLIKRLLLIPSL